MSNNYNEPVSVRISGEEVTIPAYSNHTFELSSYALDNVTIYAQGDYFYFYRENISLSSGATTYHSLEANRGWYGIRNNSTIDLSFPKFGSSYFMYDSNHNYVATGDFNPGTTLYMPFDEGDSRYSDITFYIEGVVGTKRVTSYFSKPEIGQTIIVTITGSTTIVD